MKSEDKIICKETWLKVHKIINNQIKDKLIYIQTWVIIRDKYLFNVLHQLIIILEKWFNWQTSAAIIIYDYQE